MVKANLGIAVLARWAVAPHLNTRTLQAIPLGRRGVRRKWYAVTAKSRRAPAYLEYFIELLAEKGSLV